MSSLERRPNWSPANSASGGSPTLGSSSMPPNITAPKIQLYHALLSTTKHQRNRRTDILLWICRPPSLRYVLLLSLLSPSYGLSLCAWEKRDMESRSAAWSVAFSADRPGTYRLSTKSSRLQPEPTYRPTSLATYALYMLQLQFTSPFTDFLAFKPFPFFLSWEFCSHDNAIVNGGGEKIGTRVILHFENKKQNPKLICCTLIKMRTMTF